MSYYNLIRQWRELRGMTQDELAAASGFKSGARLGMYERGERKLTLEAAADIASGLKVSLPTFLEGPYSDAPPPVDETIDPEYYGDWASMGGEPEDLPFIPQLDGSAAFDEKLGRWTPGIEGPGPELWHPQWDGTKLSDTMVCVEAEQILGRGAFRRPVGTYLVERNIDADQFQGVGLFVEPERSKLTVARVYSGPDDEWPGPKFRFVAYRWTPRFIPGEASRTYPLKGRLARWGGLPPNG